VLRSLLLRAFALRRPRGTATGAWVGLMVRPGVGAFGSGAGVLPGFPLSLAQWLISERKQAGNRRRLVMPANLRLE